MSLFFKLRESQGRAYTHLSVALLKMRCRRQHLIVFFK